jgi:lysophospholipase L1-like esterase
VFSNPLKSAKGQFRTNKQENRRRIGGRKLPTITRAQKPTQSRRAPAAWFLLLSYAAPLAAAPEAWEEAVRKFEAADRSSPPPKHAVLFVGSSSIRLWDLAASFPGLTAVNRGFGGSEMADSAHFFERLVLPHAPRSIVLYAGDNDCANGKSPEAIAAAYRDFAAKAHGHLPQARLVVIAIKPSPARWPLFGRMHVANELLRAAAAEDPRRAFVDVAAPMLGAQGMPRPELFLADGLHLNAAGYRLWSELLLPQLEPTAAQGAPGRACGILQQNPPTAPELDLQCGRFRASSPSDPETSDAPYAAPQDSAHDVETELGVPALPAPALGRFTRRALDRGGGVAIGRGAGCCGFRAHRFLRGLLPALPQRR